MSQTPSPTPSRRKAALIALLAIALLLAITGAASARLPSQDEAPPPVVTTETLDPAAAPLAPTAVAALTLIKVPTNDHWGKAAPDDFLLTIDGNPAQSNVPAPLEAGTYVINETQLPGYEFVSITGDPQCPAALPGPVTLVSGDNVVCT